MGKKRIGVLGSGIVGRTLAEGFMKKGYSVCIGSGQPEKLDEWMSGHPDAKTGNMSETATYGEILVLAVKGIAARELVATLRTQLAGKLVLDATNPISSEPPENGLVQFFTDLNSSLMESLQQEAADAHFVKAWNSIGNSKMVDPMMEQKPTMFICGDNEQSKQLASEILVEFGFEVEDMGGVTSARIIEPLCILWCLPGFLGNGWEHGFRIVR